ncbi:hypothetical protein ACDZ29_21290 [Peribacillus sp. RS7]|jgi:hypothetical protein
MKHMEQAETWVSESNGSTTSGSKAYIYGNGDTLSDQCLYAN